MNLLGFKNEKATQKNNNMQQIVFISSSLDYTYFAEHPIVAYNFCLHEIRHI